MQVRSFLCLSLCLCSCLCRKGSLILGWLLLAILLGAGPGPVATPAFAQKTDRSERADPVRTWSETARRAEEVLQAGRASSDSLEVLRAELAAQRQEAETASSAADVIIRSLTAQIASLGPPPPKDQPEPEIVAERRKQLTAELARAQQPVVEARQAYARADVLIEEIDTLVRSRSATSLLERKPSPLIPATWEQAAADLRIYAEKLEDDLERSLQPTAERMSFVEDRLLPALLIIVVALVLPIGIGHFVLISLERRVRRGGTPLRFIMKVAGLHLMRLALSFIAGMAIIAALILVQDGIHSADNLSGALTVMILIFIIADWLGNVLFNPNQPSLRLVSLSTGLARTCYWLAMAFAASLGVDALVDGASDDYAFAPASLSMLEGISILIGCLVLSVLARVLRRVADEMEAPADGAAAAIGEGPTGVGGAGPTGLAGPSGPAGAGGPAGSSPVLDDSLFGPAFFRVCSRMMQALAILSLVAASLGYVPLARASLSPTMLTLMVFGLAFILHHALMMPIRATLARRSSSAELASLLVGLGLFLVCLPLFALIWGAREAEVGEVWRVLQNGIDLGGIRLSPKILFVLFGTFILGLFVTRWSQRVVDRMILPKTQIDPGGRNAIRTGLGYVGFILSALLAISMAGLDLSNLAIIAGALSVGVGFGMQTIVSNFVSGIILLIERPIKEGDWIEVSGFSGTVRKIAVRSTRIETFDRHDVIIPNADLIAGTVKNMTLSSHVGRMIIPIGLAYGSDLDRARNILLDIAQTHPGILSYPEPQVFFRNFGNNALDFELRCFLRDVGTEIGVRSDLLFSLNAAFAEAGIEIPFAQSDITIRNLDEILAKLPNRKTETEAKTETETQSERERAPGAKADGSSQPAGE